MEPEGGHVFSEKFNMYKCKLLHIITVSVNLWNMQLRSQNLNLESRKILVTESNSSLFDNSDIICNVMHVCSILVEANCLIVLKKTVFDLDFVR